MYKYINKEFKPKQYDHFPKMEGCEIKEEAERCWNFLKKIHAELQIGTSKESYEVQGMDLAIEIRPLRSDQGQFDRYVKPHYIYRFDQEQEKKFIAYCKRLFNPKKSRRINGIKIETKPFIMPFCMYYSVFLTDMNIQPYKADGTGAKLQMTGNTAHCTQSLSIDLDKISEANYLEYKQKLMELGLESIDVFSGHGYQMHFLLDKPHTDLSLLEKFNKAVRNFGIPADDKVIDCSRILRLGFFNSKGVLEGDPNYFGTPVVRVEEVADTNKRYSIEEIFTLLGTEYQPPENPRGLRDRRFLGETYADYLDYPFPDKKIGNLKKSIQKEKKIAERAVRNAEKRKNEIDVVKVGESLASEKGESKTKKKTSKPKGDISFEEINLHDLYPMINSDKLPDSVRQMLYGFREGLANNMLMFLTLRLKAEGYSQTAIINTMAILKELDTFDYAWDIPDDYIAHEVGRFYHKYKNVNEAGFEQLTEEFGDLTFDKNFDATQIKLANSIYTGIKNQKHGKNASKEEKEKNIEYTKIARISAKGYLVWLHMILAEHDYLAEYPDTEHKQFTLEELAKLVGCHENRIRDSLKYLMDSKVDLVSKKFVGRKNGGKIVVYSLKDQLFDCKGYLQLEAGTLEALLVRVEKGKLSPRALMIYIFIRSRAFEYGEVTLSQEAFGEVFGLDRSVVAKVLKELRQTKLIVRTKNEYKTTNSYKLTR